MITIPDRNYQTQKDIKQNTHKAQQKKKDDHKNNRLKTAN